MTSRWVLNEQIDGMLGLGGSCCVFSDGAGGPFLSSSRRNGGGVPLGPGVHAVRGHGIRHEESLRPTDCVRVLCSASAAVHLVSLRDTIYTCK